MVERACTWYAVSIVRAKPYGIHILLGGLYINTKRPYWLACVIYSTLVVLDILYGIFSVAYTVVHIWSDNVALTLKQFNYVLLRLLTLGLVMTGLLRTQNMDDLFPMLVRYRYMTPLSPQQLAIIDKYDKQFWKVFNYFKYLMYIVNTVWIAILPMVEITLNEVILHPSTNTTRKFGQYIPVLAWHPYDPDIFISFLIQYLLQVFFTFLLCHTAVGITASYIDVAIFLISSFKVLKISLQEIKQRALHLYCMSTNGEQRALHLYCMSTNGGVSERMLDDERVAEDPRYQKHLLGCLREDLEHQLQLRRIQRGMLEIYGPILLFLLLIGGVFLCTKAITLLEINKLNDAHLFRNLFRMIQSVLSFTSYIFVFCWYGEEITQAGAEVFDALYFCPWFNTPNKLKRAIHTMMICNLKASQMSVAGLKTLNLKTFGEVVSAAYSYFNIVRSMK